LPQQKREVLSREVRMQSILDASQRIFSCRPYDEIAIEDIAAEASMSNGLLYHYFSSKRDLYLETLRHVFATLGQIPETCRDLHTCLDAYLLQFEQFPTLARMAFRGGIGMDAEADALLATYQRQQSALLSQYVSHITTVSPLVQLGLQGWSSFFQEVCLQWVEQQDIPRDQVLALLEENLQAIISSAEQKRYLTEGEPG
jgi:AcrR family transcriptional regulator